MDDKQISTEIILQYVRREWISPSKPNSFDEEDRARATFIRQLQEDFGVNDEAVSLILHLVDQLNFLRNEIRRCQN